MVFLNEIEDYSYCFSLFTTHNGDRAQKKRGEFPSVIVGDWEKENTRRGKKRKEEKKEEREKKEKKEEERRRKKKKEES